MSSRRINALMTVIVGTAYLLIVARLVSAIPSLIQVEAAILQGTSAEALEGTTPGRQALAGSAWWGPLPMLAHLALTVLLRWIPFGPAPGLPLAVLLSAGSVMAGCLWLLQSPRTTEGLSPESRQRPSTLPLALLAVLPSALRLAGGGSAEALVFPLALPVILEGSAWLATGRIRHLVPTGFAMAALLLCGTAAWGWVFLGLLLLVLGTLRKRALAARLPGLLLLGTLPMLYAFGVWFLLNWLILQDRAFFLRVLEALSTDAWRDPHSVLPDFLEQAAFSVCAGGMLLGIARRDARHIGYGLAGMAAAGWLRVLSAHGLFWVGDATRLGLAACALLTLARWTASLTLRHPAKARGAQMALVLLVLLPLPRLLRQELAPSEQRWNAGDEIVEAVQAHVAAISRHPRVFICGYEGMGLLRGNRREERFVPVMDFHLESLRRDYWGQTLFVLVRKPVGRARMESLRWREPDFYLLGSSRTLLSADFGDWRLYEIVSAPLLRQLHPSPSVPRPPLPSGGPPPDDPEVLLEEGGAVHPAGDPMGALRIITLPPGDPGTPA